MSLKYSVSILTSRGRLRAIFTTADAGEAFGWAKECLEDIKEKNSTDTIEMTYGGHPISLTQEQPKPFSL